MTRQGFVLSALLGGVLLLSYTSLYREITNRSRGQIDAFPRTLGTWQMVGEYPPSKREIELLETENIMTRVYRNDKGREVALVLVYDPSGNRKMAHPQEVCLSADGMQTISKSSVPLKGTDFNAERLLMQRNTRQQLYYYWYKAGSFQSGSYMNSQLRLALHSLTGGAGGTALIRLSAAVGKDPSYAEESLQEFGLLIQPELQRYLP